MPKAEGEGYNIPNCKLLMNKVGGNIIRHIRTPYVGMARKNGSHMKSTQMTQLKCLR